MDDILRKILDKPNKVTAWFEHGETKQIVKVTLEGNGICCRDIRNRIVMGWPSEGWSQLRLEREEFDVTDSE